MNAASPAAARQRPWLAPLLAVALVVFIVAGVLWFTARSLTSGLCGSSEISRLTAPDGHHDAVLFEHNCGATTDFATHVSVLPAGAPLGSGAGNAFAAEAGEVAPRAPWGGPPVEIAWDANGALVIRYDAAAEAFHTAQEVDGVAIQSHHAP